MLRKLKLLLAGAVASGAAPARPPLDTTPDLPSAFGYKILWFAIRANDTAAVVSALAWPTVGPANWQSGLAAAMQMPTDPKAPRHAFVAPPLHGWVLVVGAALPYPDAGSEGDPSGIGARFRAMQRRLAERFADVQFFGSHRVVGFVTWSRLKPPAPERTFSFGDGTTMHNLGAQSAEEARLGFADVSGLSHEAATQRLFELSEARDEAIQKQRQAGGAEAARRERELRRQPVPDEEDVLELAALWSFSPMTLPGDASPGTGMLVQMPYPR